MNPHLIRACVGNGLGRDIWEEFRTRFDIPRILEFYGSTGTRPCADILFVDARGFLTIEWCRLCHRSLGAIFSVAVFQ